MPIFQSIPNANQILAISQVDLKNNFEFIRFALGKDHAIAFGDDSSTNTVGLHNQLSLLARSNNPALLSGANAMISSNSGNLYWKNATTPAAIKLTVTQAAVPTNATNGVTFLPGNLLMQWGQSTTTDTAFPALPTVNFTAAFSAPPYSVQCTIFNSADAGRVVQVRAVTATTMTVTTRDTGGGKVANITYSWLAIGPA